LKFGATLGAFCFCSAGLFAADAPLPVVRVCDILRDLPSYRGTAVAVIGRFSFREGGRFLTEKACSTKDDGQPDRPTVVVLYDSKSAPKPPHDLYFDRRLVDKQLELIRRQTSLASFRFGSQDYDRWAVVYGRIEMNKESTLRSKSLGGEFEPAPARIICSSSTMVVFLAD